MATATAPRYPLTHRQIQTVFGGLMAGMFLAALDQTIVATALPTIVGEFGGLDHISWVASAYLLTSTAVMPVAGKLSDLYGRRQLFQASIVVFLVGSLLAGIAQSMAQLIAFRALQGAGAGGLLVLTFAIVGDVVAPRERGRYQGYVASVFAVASVAGPLLGGFFVDHLSWRWVFYVNLPVGLVALVITSSALRMPVRREGHTIDYLGAALLVGAITSVILLTVWGGNEYPWGSPTIVGLGVAGAILLVLFVLQERRAAEPILPLRLFRNSVFTVSTATAFTVGLAMFGAILFLPLYLQIVKGSSATNSGLLLLPIMAGILTGSTTCGRIITRVGRYKPFPVAGLALMTIGFVCFSRMDASTPGALSAVFMVLTGVGIGFVTPVLVLAVQNAVDQRDLGAATSAVTFLRTMGGAFGAAVFGAVLNARLTVELAARLPRDALRDIDPARLQGSPAQIRALPPDVQDGVIRAFDASLQTVFLVAALIGLAAFVLIWWLRELPLQQRDDLSDVRADGVVESLGSEAHL
ncbi:MAG: MFS transporter [Actinobacteria bacterium]|nr:MFS transporter [Actinomycetota bacterium]